MITNNRRGEMNKMISGKIKRKGRCKKNLDLWKLRICSKCDRFFKTKGIQKSFVCPKCDNGEIYKKKFSEGFNMINYYRLGDSNGEIEIIKSNISLKQLEKVIKDLREKLPDDYTADDLMEGIKSLGFSCSFICLKEVYF